MKLTFTKAAQQRLTRFCQPGTRLILDFDDGVGSLSRFGACSMDGAYRLLVVNDDQGADYSGVIDSNLGPIAYLPADKAQFDDKMELRFDRRHLSLPLVSPHEILSPNVELVDLRDQSVTAAKLVENRGC